MWGLLIYEGCVYSKAMDTQQSETEQKTQRSRRMWRKFEEDALIKIMVKEISDRWTADNGFRPGFFILLEKELAKVLPDSNLKASPHIDSKVRYWKMTYNKVYDIVSLSGFGWDYDNQRIDVDDDVWKQFKQGHLKRAEFVEGKRFPYYEQWSAIFGKDRATGVGAEDPAEMEVPIPNNPPNVQVDVNDSYIDDPYYPYLGQEFYSDSTPIISTQMDSTASGSTPQSSTPSASAPPASATPPESTPLASSTPTGSTRRTSLPTSSPLASTPPTNVGHRRGRKRSRMGDEESSIIRSMDNFLKGSLGYMDKMVDKMGFEKELSGRRLTVPEELEKLDLTLDAQFKLAAIICEKDERVDQFFGTHDDKRHAWVDAVLAGRVFGPV